MEDWLDTSKSANEFLDLVEAEDVAYVGKVVFERMSDRLVSSLRCIFKSEIGRNAMLNGGIFYFKQNSWWVVEVSKSVRSKLGDRIRSGSIGKSMDKVHHLLHQLEGCQRREGLNINVRLGLTLIIYEAMQRVKGRRVWTWPRRVQAREGRESG